MLTEIIGVFQNLDWPIALWKEPLVWKSTLGRHVSQTRLKALQSHANSRLHMFPVASQLSNTFQTLDSKWSMQCMKVREYMHVEINKAANTFNIPAVNTQFRRFLEATLTSCHVVLLVGCRIEFWNLVTWRTNLKITEVSTPWRNV
jgi:hypothetical protein